MSLGLFLVASWLGLWLGLPIAARIAGVALFGLALVASFWGFVRPLWPSRRAAITRLDQRSGLAHRPAATLDDTLANAGGDAGTAHLWALHRQRAEAATAAMRVTAPSPRVAARDRLALRFAVVVALVAAAVVAGPEKYPRVVAAFAWKGETPLPPGFRIDAWLDPPAYTGRPPILLTGRSENAPGGAERRVDAPVGSMLVVRTADADGVKVDVSGGLDVPQKPETPAAGAPTSPPAVTATAPAKSASGESRWRLTGDARVAVTRLGRPVAAFALTAIPDKPPTIVLNGEPKSTARAALTLAYTIADDYGIVGAEARASNPILHGKPVVGRTLVAPPKMPLALPPQPGGLGTGETTADLSDSPWGGARVTLTLAARDEGGNEGTSTPTTVTLPQRPFSQPMARALVEQRRNLVLAPDDRARVSIALEGLNIAPDTFRTPPAIYLGIDAIARRLDGARTDDDLRAVADLMWEMALRIEDGDLTQTARDLRAAQQQLREAMQRGASPEELRRLTDQLRQAMDKFLREFAQRQMQNRDQQAQMDPNARMLTQQDLQNMLDRMENMARNGDMADAQRMLDQLQQMLENLQMAQRGQSQASREMNQAMSDLDRMTREQQQLRDKTFRQGQKQANRGQQQGQRGQQGQQGQRGQQGQQGQQGQPGDQAGQDDDGGDQSADNDDGGDDPQALQQQQQALQQQLDALRERMKQLGMPGAQGLDDAEDAMNEAQQQLGKGQGGRDGAVGAQGRALEALRRGAQQMAQQMQGNGQGQGQGDMPGNPNGPMRQGRGNANADPLGREAHGRTDDSRSRYDPLGVPAAQRAQQVLEELRRRLGDPSRPQEERDYLERLVQPY